MMMPISHKKEFGIYHWDTFDNTTILIGEADTPLEAMDLLNEKYGDRIKANGADRVDIVNSKGHIIENFNIC